LESRRQLRGLHLLTAPPCAARRSSGGCFVGHSCSWCGPQRRCLETSACQAPGTCGAAAASITVREANLGGRVQAIFGIPEPAKTTSSQAELEAKLHAKLVAGNRCRQVMSCSLCAALSECGWCAAAGACVPGDKLAAYDEPACPSYAFASCPGGLMTVPPPAAATAAETRDARPLCGDVVSPSSPACSSLWSRILGTIHASSARRKESSHAFDADAILKRRLDVMAGEQHDLQTRIRKLNTTEPCTA